jgi:hypothetical protein
MEALLRPLAAALLALALPACGAPSPADGAPAAAPARGGDALARAALGEGWVVWESNRTGEFRLWIRPLAGGPARQLTRDEPERDHCCPHLSPDGTRVAYLALPPGARPYDPTAVGELRLIRVDGRDERALAAARHYGEHRAAVWWSATELAHIDGEGRTRRLDLARGRSEVLAHGDPAGQGWLIDPTGRWASSNSATFSDRDIVSGRVRLATEVGGCQAYFTADGELGYWTAGAGGPIDVIDLETRATRSLLRRNDPRLPEGQGYIYFPMVSRDRSLLAVAASPGEHDHFKGRYDVFLLELDPETLAPLGRAIRVTDEASVDRYPDVWRLAALRRPTRARARPQAADAATGPSAPPPIFLWRTATDANRRAPGEPSEALQEHGAVWFDRRGWLALAGGHYSAHDDSAARVQQRLKDANTLSFALLFEPRALDGTTDGVLVTQAYTDREIGFLVRQRADRLELVLRRGNGRNRTGGAPFEIARLADTSPRHLAVSFSPGRLAAFVDGRETLRTAAPGDFFHWRTRGMRIGALIGGRGGVRGYLAYLTIWDRELAAEELAAEARTALAAAAAAPAVERTRVEARLVARSRPATLAAIAPYRRALVVEEYERLRALDGPEPPARFRVARWSLLDGEPTRPMALAPGATVELLLEPREAQPQLEGSVVADTLPPAPDLPVYFEVGLADG